MLFMKMKRAYMPHITDLVLDVTLEVRNTTKL